MVVASAPITPAWFVLFVRGGVRMLMSQWAMGGAASQVRSIDGNLQSLVSELVASGVWSGPDADRFAQDWYDSVHTPLVVAANTMYAISFEILE